jgi:hypothetical protein
MNRKKFIKTECWSKWKIFIFFNSFVFKVKKTEQMSQTSCATFWDAFSQYYMEGKNEKDEFQTGEGMIRFFKPNPKEEKGDQTLDIHVCIHAVVVLDHLQRQKVFSRFLGLLANTPEVKRIAILGVSTDEMQKCLENTNLVRNQKEFVFQDFGGDFVCDFC